MITTPTTFVVGAGASSDYGLPTSDQLRKLANELKPEHTSFQMILAADLCTPQQLNKILDDLRSQGTRSIDEFLFARQDDTLTMKVGRTLIALLLGSHFPDVRSPDSLVTEPTDWLGHIIYKMWSGAPDCQAFVQGNAEVRFVTFNFDSIIEDRFEKALRNLYGAADAHLQNAVKAIHGQIIHVHGRFPPAPGSRLQSGLRVPDDTNDWIEWLSSASSEIRVVMDQIDANILTASQRAVRRSKILCFLGFAYANDNLARLGLPKVLYREVDDEPVNRDIYGTAYGIPPGEQARITNKLDGAVLGGETEHCINFLGNQPIFRD